MCRARGCTPAQTCSLHLYSKGLTQPWNWIRRLCPAVGPQGPAATTRPLPDAPVWETSSNPGPSEWPVAGSEEYETPPPLPCWEGSVDTTPSGVFRDDARRLVLSPRYPLLSGPAGGTGSVSSGGWKNRSEHMGGQFSERGGAAGMRAQERTAASVGGPPLRAPNEEWEPAEATPTCPLLLFGKEAVVKRSCAALV